MAEARAAWVGAACDLCSVGLRDGFVGSGELGRSPEAPGERFAEPPSAGQELSGAPPRSSAQNHFSVPVAWSSLLPFGHLSPSYAAWRPSGAWPSRRSTRLAGGEGGLGFLEELSQVFAHLSFRSFGGGPARALPKSTQRRSRRAWCSSWPTFSQVSHTRIESNRAMRGRWFSFLQVA